MTLRGHRKQRGLTLPELAELSGLNPDTIRRAERGYRLTERTARLLADALDVPVSELVAETPLKSTGVGPATDPNSRAQKARDLYTQKPWMTTTEIGRAVGLTQGGAWSAINVSGMLIRQREKDPLLPLQPFQEWVRKTLERRDMTFEDFAELAGVDEARVRFWLNPQYVKAGRTYIGSNIRLSTVDRVTLQVTGDPFVMYEMYPHLQDVPENVVA